VLSSESSCVILLRRTLTQDVAVLGGKVTGSAGRIDGYLDQQLCFASNSHFYGGCVKKLIDLMLKEPRLDRREKLIK
jgi:hypothetical protein